MNNKYIRSVFSKPIGLIAVCFWNLIIHNKKKSSNMAVIESIDHLSSSWRPQKLYPVLHWWGCFEYNEPTVCSYRWIILNSVDEKLTAQKIFNTWVKQILEGPRHLFMDLCQMEKNSKNKGWKKTLKVGGIHSMLLSFRLIQCVQLQMSLVIIMSSGNLKQNKKKIDK